MRDKRIVITGASTGIGRELAVQLAAQGARLVLAARSEEKLREVADQCRTAGGEALVAPTDVADEAACLALVEAAVAAYGGIDIFVNNAALSAVVTRFDELDNLTAFETLMRVNFLGTVYCTRHALPHLKQSGGLMVAVSSLQGKTGFPRATAYCASKHAVQGFCDALRIELADSGVDVLVVSPGPVATDIHQRKLGHDGTISVSSRDFRDKKMMPVARCVQLMVGAMRARKRELIMTSGGRLAVRLKPFAPRFVDKRVARAMAEFHEP